MSREILTYPLEPQQIRVEFNYFVEYLTSREFKTCEVLFGSAWENEYYPTNDWNSMEMETHNQLMVAEKQLDRAIKLFLDDGDFYSAGTLAGAAEEILGKLISKQGHEHALDSIITAMQKMLAPDEIDAITDGSRRSQRGSISDLLNFYRNWLKHYREDNFEINIDVREAAAELIDRAVTNFVQLVQRDTEQMQRFLDFQRSEYS